MSYPYAAFILISLALGFAFYRRFSAQRHSTKFRNIHPIGMAGTCSLKPFLRCMFGVKKRNPCQQQKTNFRRDFSYRVQLHVEKIFIPRCHVFCCCVGKVNTFLPTMQVFSYLFAENFHIFAVPVAKICCST